MLQAGLIELLIQVAIGLLAGVGYASLGYFTQSEPFDLKKFLTTIVIASTTALGLSITGFVTDPYTATVGPIAITVLIKKFLRQLGIVE